jgi:hypothetical protein
MTVKSAISNPTGQAREELQRGGFARLEPPLLPQLSLLPAPRVFRVVGGRIVYGVV